MLLNGPNGNDGARALADGLQAAVGGTTQLDDGVKRILGGVVRVRAQADQQQAALRQGGTDVTRALDSGYFVLAAIQGADPQIQSNAGFVTNVAGGGGTARVVVIGSAGPFDPASVDMARQLRRETAITARQMDATTAVVGGPAVLLHDFDTNTTARFPYLVAALVLITFVVLLVLFRSPVLAFCAVILNLVTVGAAVGVLVICFQGDTPLLGGPGYLDAIALSGLFAIIFGLAIDYEVFLITRLLEGRERTGTTEGAIHYGAREDRHDHHRRGVHHGRRVPRVLGLAGLEHPPVRRGPDGRGAARRDDRAADPAAGADPPVRRAHLARAQVARPDPPAHRVALSEAGRGCAPLGRRCVSGVCRGHRGEVAGADGATVRSAFIAQWRRT